MMKVECPYCGFPNTLKPPDGKSIATCDSSVGGCAEDFVCQITKVIKCHTFKIVSSDDDMIESDCDCSWNSTKPGPEHDEECGKYDSEALRDAERQTREE